jgi:hypothetical protein
MTRDLVCLAIGGLIALAIQSGAAKSYDEKKAESRAEQRSNRIAIETKYQSCLAACNVKCAK